MKKANKAFTLAEVLITLAILGIVAAITIPAIIANKDKAAWTAQLQKTYATIENARRLTAIDEGGDISGLFASTDTTQGNVAFQSFAKHLNISKNCGPAMGCWYDGMKMLNNTLYNSDGKFESYVNGLRGKAILSDGTLIFLQSYNSSCSTNISSSYGPLSYANTCGEIYVDLNGTNPPNIWGRDIFNFDITREGIYPYGMNQSDAIINSNCSDSSSGWECSAKVIKEGAENY